MFFQATKDPITKVLFLFFLLFPLMLMGRTLFADESKSLSFRISEKNSFSNNIREKQGDEEEYLITVYPGTKPEKLRQLFQETLVFARKISKKLFHIKLKPKVGLEKLQEYRDQNLWMIAVQPNYTYEAFKSPVQRGTLQMK